MRFVTDSFRRQYVIGRFIADFCCEDLHLIIELDGGQHSERVEQDRLRTMQLEDMKYLVLRFWNFEVLTGMDGVIDSILSVIRDIDRVPSPQSSPYGRGG